MHIAITGGSGNFAGVLIRHLLSRGHTVRSIDLPAREPHAGANEHRSLDLRDADAVKHALAGCDGVAHLAAIPGLSDRIPDTEVYANNTVISYNVLCAAGDLGIKHVCLASSINAIGGPFGRKTAFRAFPIDEAQPCFAEDAYSLSKWVMEQQADATARRFDGMAIASLRFHALAEGDPEPQVEDDATDAPAVRGLWGYTRVDAAARAAERSLCATFAGHEVFYIVAPRTTKQKPSRELAAMYFPTVPITHEMKDNTSFYACSKAAHMLGWLHDEEHP